MKHKGPAFDPKSGEILTLGDIRWRFVPIVQYSELVRRQKLKRYYEEFLLDFEKSNAHQAEITSKNLGHYIRCACGNLFQLFFQLSSGHSHCEVPKGACVTCDHYLETRKVTSGLSKCFPGWSFCNTDLVQCEACGAWQVLRSTHFSYCFSISNVFWRNSSLALLKFRCWKHVKTSIIIVRCAERRTSPILGPRYL